MDKVKIINDSEDYKGTDNDKTKYELRVNYNPMDETFTLITGPNQL